MKLPLRDDGTVDAIYSSYEKKQKESPPRAHLGASEIGRECERQIWYGFRWVAPIEFPGRILRLFDTGKLAESRLINDLTDVGVEVVPFDMQTGKQFRLEIFGGHFGGSLDGLCIGLLEAPKTWHLTEFKTHNEKSYKSLVDKGVASSKPEHFIQMQAYMGMSHEKGQDKIPQLTRAAYLAVNKNNDSLYLERVEYDRFVYERIKSKANRIIFADRPPARISENPDYFACRWCSYRSVCHGLEDFELPRVNCRTCMFSTPKEDGQWYCEHEVRPKGRLSIYDQARACGDHLFLPEMLPWEQVDAVEAESVIYRCDGKVYVNHAGGTIEG